MTYASGVVAAGVFPVWPVVQQRFADAGVFGYMCDEQGMGCEDQEEALSLVNIVGFSAMMITTWPGGMVFDSLGPKRCASAGCLLVSISQACCAVAASAPAGYSYLMYPGAVLGNLGGMLQSYCLYGFLWHSPNNQGSLIGLSGSAGAAGTLFALVVVAVLPFTTALWYLSVGALVAFVMELVYVPSSQEFADAAVRCLGERPAAPPGRSTLQMCWKCFKANYEDNLYFSVSLTLLISFLMYYLSVQAPYLTLLLHSEQDAEIVATAGTSLYGIAGMVLGPASGALSDTFGVRTLLMLIASLNLVQSAMAFVPNLFAQMVGAWAGAVFMSLYLTYAGKFLTLYAPPEYYGSFFGLLGTLSGFVAMIICLVCFGISSLLLDDLPFFMVPMALLATGSVGSTIFFAWHMQKRELPSAPPVVDG